MYAIIPTTRPCRLPLPSPSWAAVDTGIFGTNDPFDQVQYRIDHGVVLAVQLPAFPPFIPGGFMELVELILVIGGSSSGGTDHCFSSLATGDLRSKHREATMPKCLASFQLRPSGEASSNYTSRRNSVYGTTSSALAASTTSARRSSDVYLGARLTKVGDCQLIDEQKHPAVSLGGLDRRVVGLS